MQADTHRCFRIDTKMESLYFKTMRVKAKELVRPLVLKRNIHKAYVLLLNYFFKKNSSGAPI